MFGATMMGLGSILGTGIFVSIGIAAGAAGPAVLLAIAVAAFVALCNALSSAQLAANHPVSGGTYEYGYRWLHPSLGFTAGWMFLCAKCASAATAALGFASYTLNAFGEAHSTWRIPLAATIVVILTALVLAGIRRSTRANMLIVSVTILSLVIFVLGGLPILFESGMRNLQPFFAPTAADSAPLGGFLEACALMFVAYTGYGRVATLGEEIHEPRRNIPLAILVTLVISLLLYLAVGLVATATIGPRILAEAVAAQAAPLRIVAEQFDFSIASSVVAVGAVTAMAGVLLNLILGLSRVVLAMARNRDLPSILARLDRSQSTPYLAVILVGCVIMTLTIIGDVGATWSFSAFTVLIYYSLTNLAAIQLNEKERLYPRLIPWLGLSACLFLAFWVDMKIWILGLGLIGMGLIWHAIAKRGDRAPIDSQRTK